MDAPMVVTYQRTEDNIRMLCFMDGEHYNTDIHKYYARDSCEG